MGGGIGGLRRRRGLLCFVRHLCGFRGRYIASGISRVFFLLLRHGIGIFLMIEKRDRGLMSPVTIQYSVAIAKHDVLRRMTVILCKHDADKYVYRLLCFFTIIEILA